MIKKFSNILAVFADKLVISKSAPTGKGRIIALSLFFVLSVSVLVTVVVSTIYTHEAVAAPNTTVNFQARILKNTGALVADGNYSIQFKVYNSLAGPTSQWNETQVVSIKNGYASVSLGAVNAFGSSVDWSQEQWLTMNINGDGEMAPRMKVTGVPLAFRAVQAETLTNGAGTISASQLAQLAPGSVQGVSSVNTALRINQTGAGNLLQLQSAGVDKLLVANNGDATIGGALSVASGVTLGNSSSTTAGTIRWTGAVFEGYNGTAWTSLGGSALGNPIINKVKLVNEVQNSSVNATATLQNDDELFFNIGSNETWTYRFMIQGNANATPDFKFAVTAPSGATCQVGYSDPEGATSISNLGCGASTGLVPGNTANDFYEVVGTVTNGANAGNVQLQWAQNTANAANSTIYAGSSVLATRAVGPNGSAQAFIQNGNSFGTDAFLGTNDNNNLNFITNSTTKMIVLANGNVGIGDATPASLLTVGGSDAFQVNNNGDTSTSGTLTVNGQSKFNNNVVAGGIATGTTANTEATPRTNVTTVTLATGAFANNDVIFINNAGQDYYTRIVSGGGTVNLVVSPVVSYDAGAVVEKYTVQNIGATSNDYITKANRFFQGYFLGGIVVGAGSTTISDGNIDSTTALTLQKNGGALDVGGALNVTGAISGDGSGITNIDGAHISNGTIADLSLSSNVTLLGNTFNGSSQLLQLNGSGKVADTLLSSNITALGNAFNGVNQLVQLDGSGYLPALNGSALTSLNGTNISSGTVSDGRLSSNVTLQGNTFNGSNQLLQLNGTGKVADTLLTTNITAAGNSFNGISQLVQLNASGALSALDGSNLTTLNASNISSGTIVDLRLSSNVTLLGNTFNGNNQLIQLNASGQLPTLSGVNLTDLNGTNITTGTVADGRLSSNVTLLGNTFNGSSQLLQLNGSGKVADTLLSSNITALGNAFNGVNQLVQLDGSGYLPALNGSALTSLNGTNISSGTVSDSLLSSNVGLLSLSQTYTAEQTYSNGLVLGNSTSTTAGALRWNGTDFQGYDGLTWLSLSGNGAAPISVATIQAYDGIGGTDLNTSTPIAVPWDTETKKDNGFTHSNVTNNTRVALAEAGWYKVSYQVNGLNQSGNRNTVFCQVRFNGTTYNSPSGSYSYARNNVDAGGTNSSSVYVQTMVANEYYEVLCSQSGSSGPQYAVAGGSWTIAEKAAPISGGITNQFIQGGNSFGLDATIGTADSHTLSLAANGNTGLVIATNGDVTANNSLSISGTISGNGSGLTNLNGTNISSGTIADGRLTTNVTLLGNTFNGNNQLVQLNSGGALPALDGSNLTTLNASNISSGTIADLRLSSNVTLLGNTFNGNNQLVQLNSSGQLPTLSGVNLTNLNATNIASGTINDTRLSTNVILLNQNAVLGSLELGNDTTPTAGLLQLNDATASNGFKVNLTSVTALTANRNISLPDEGGTICLSNSNNCGYIRLASGSAQTDSTTNNSLFINKTGASGNLITLQKNGTNVFTVSNNGSLEIRQTSTTALAIKNASGTDFLNIDTSGAIVRIGSSTADSTGTILVLDTKNTTGDPTGADGGMYYNSSIGKFRCYESGTWMDCIGTRQVRSFIDTTSDSAIDSNTTSYWDTGTENNNSVPNIYPSTTNKSITGSVSMEVTSATTADRSIVTRVERSIGSVAACGSGTAVGTILNTFTTNNGEQASNTMIFLDSPNTTSRVYYTLCSDSATSSGANMTINRIRITLEEANNSN